MQGREVPFSDFNAPMSKKTKDQHPEVRRIRRINEYFHLVSQTAEFRNRECWRGARELLAARGVTADGAILIACSSGDEIHAEFVLPDGSAVECDFQEDPTFRQAVAIAFWRVLPRRVGADDEFGLAEETVSTPKLRQAFDKAVKAFFDFHWRGIDQPLPALDK